MNRSGNKDRIELEIKSMWFRGIMANGINPHHSPVHMKVFSDPLFFFRVVPHPHSKHLVHPHSNIVNIRYIHIVNIRYIHIVNIR